MAIIRDYNVTVSNTTASIRVSDGNGRKTSYAALPTLAEIRRVTGRAVEVINLEGCFMNCKLLTTAPDIPNSVTNMNACFLRCESLTTAPTIPNSVTDMGNCFAYCMALTIAPAIPTSVTNMVNCFRNCKSLTTAPTIPSSVTNIFDCFNGCSVLTGKIVINANPSSYGECMADTQKEIVLTGSSTLLQNIADTATNSNVYVWSLSINLSAERQGDDLSKANVSVIINRFRNNNESVSLTFTIDSVESTPVQVTMDTATKTYTGVLSITPSSRVELSVIAEDSYGKSAPKSITIPIPFYTIDFQAGGKEIAVGAPANDDTSNRPYGLFKCEMDAQFGGNAEFYGNLVLGTPLSIANGGTGATTVAGARNALGLGNTSGALPVANGGTGATTAAAARKKLGLSGAETKTLLWTNASPTSNFAAQTVSLALSGYDAVEIVCRYSKKDDTRTRYVCDVDSSSPMYWFYYTATDGKYTGVRSRNVVSASTTGVTFNTCSGKLGNSTKNTTNDGYIIPIEIYGIKGV